MSTGEPSSSSGDLEGPGPPDPFEPGVARRAGSSRNHARQVKPFVRAVVVPADRATDRRARAHARAGGRVGVEAPPVAASGARTRARPPPRSRARQAWRRPPSAPSGGATVADRRHAHVGDGGAVRDRACRRQRRLPRTSPLRGTDVDLRSIVRRRRSGAVPRLCTTPAFAVTPGQRPVQRLERDGLVARPRGCALRPAVGFDAGVCSAPLDLETDVEHSLARGDDVPILAGALRTRAASAHSRLGRISPRDQGEPISSSSGLQM